MPSNNIVFTMNGLTLVFDGIGGHLFALKYTNADVVNYVFQVTHKPSGAFYTYTFKANTLDLTDLGPTSFRPRKTADYTFSFLGAYLPQPGE